MNKMLTTPQAAEFLQLPIGTLHIYTHQKRLPYYKIGRKNFYKIEDLENFINSRLVPAKQ